jgi:hypothetical protein
VSRRMSTASSSHSVNNCRTASISKCKVHLLFP